MYVCVQLILCALGINSVTRGKEEIVPMEKMKMAWLPFDAEIEGTRLKPGRTYLLLYLEFVLLIFALL